MTKEQFIDAVCQALHCSEKRKAEVARQLASDFDTAVEQGETWEEIESRLGTPGEMAAEFNEEFAEESTLKFDHPADSPAQTAPGRQKKKLSTGAVILIAVVSVLLVISTVIGFALVLYTPTPEHTSSLDQDDTFELDGSDTSWPVEADRALELSTDIIDALSSRQYDMILEQCDDRMKEALAENTLSNLYQTYLSSAGQPTDFHLETAACASENNVTCTVIQVLANYENGNQFLYTLSFTESEKLAGLYLRAE